jgi:CheY-like chemotaxis protein
VSHVLVIEDDPDLNEILSHILESRGLEVTAAFLGETALELFEQSEFDLVISDVLLPGIDGVETLGKLKALQPDLKCIIITGYTSEETPIRAIRLNVDDYLFKPFSTQYLMKIVQRVLDAPVQREQNRERFGKLFSKYGLSVGGMLDVSLSELLSRREDAFRGLYVGVRSAYLNQASAARIYTSLEDLENSFRNVLHSATSNPLQVADVERQYALVQERLNRLKAGSNPHRPTNQTISDDQFRPLFNAMKSGALSFHDLLYAPLLRKTPDARFETLRDLLDLKKQLWPKG